MRSANLLTTGICVLQLSYAADAQIIHGSSMVTYLTDHHLPHD